VHTEPSSWRESRILSAVELLLGAAVVLGHNVWKVVPNEVPILFVLGLSSYRLRDGSFLSIGFRKPESWIRILSIAAGAAALRIALGEYVVEPLTSRVWPPIIAPSGTESIAGNLGTAALWLLLVWTFAAFGEEIAYRGYLLGRAADALNRTPAAYVVASVVTSVLFGYGHFYKGPAGIVDSGVAGLVIDSVGVIALYFGWST
jgi:hypothetical protein